MLRVRVTERGGQQFLDGLTNQFTGRPAEHRFEGAIGRLDHTVRVHGRDALRRSLQQQSQLLQAQLQLRWSPSAAFK